MWLENYAKKTLLNLKSLHIKVKASIVHHINLNWSLRSCNANIDEIYIFLVERSWRLCGGDFWLITLVSFVTIIIAKE